VRETLTVYRKEMRAYLTGPIPYIVVALFSLATTWWVFSPQDFLLMGQASLEPLFGILPIAFAIFVPAIAMRTWAEEIRGGTIESLMTMPVRTRHVVAGKYLAAWTVVGFCLLSTVGVPITAATLGDLDVGPAVAGYLGALLMAGGFLAIGMWLSSLTSNQIVAFLLGFVVCLVLALLDHLGATSGGSAVSDLLAQVSVTGRFRAIARGVLDLRDLLYFASLVAFFLYLNVETIENRRYA
jgi:ABC-2 type transport system permease protein